ncbi:hypothetical protein [Corynebacterium vitaeruminis]|uniref:hypothetical protein n=1 Tax=Corynebacterium vitaeruminis TaxID=38305 RepID=UPI0028AD32C4|nr:hypothetical protein [Corynebacterium vitaeruminis]
MTNAFATPVINSEQLAPLLGDPRLVVLDASMAGAAKATEFLPGARYFDIDRDFSDLANPFPHGLAVCGGVPGRRPQARPQRRLDHRGLRGQGRVRQPARLVALEVHGPR